MSEMFGVVYFIGFLHSVPQLQNSQQVMFNFRQGQIVGLAHFRHLQGLGKSTGKGLFVKVTMGNNILSTFLYP